MIDDVEVLEGEWQADAPCIVLDAEFARRAIEAKELELHVWQALQAMELSGRMVAVLREVRS